MKSIKDVVCKAVMNSDYLPSAGGGAAFLALGGFFDASPFLEASAFFEASALVLALH